MRGIPLDKWLKIKPEELRAMQANYAETFGVPLDRVGWREKTRRGVRQKFLFLKRAKGGA